jgi:hypothetical protein|tara:strand:+ start:3212 stop:3463 length:252 start_codon:yes stop_codon:yes gene_type:complete
LKVTNVRYDVLIEIDEDGKILIKDECEVGKEQESMDEIREMLKDLADVGQIEHLPPSKEKPRYEGVGKDKKKSKKKQKLRGGK